MATIPGSPWRAVAAFAYVAGIGAEREAQRNAHREATGQGRRVGALRDDPVATDQDGE